MAGPATRPAVAAWTAPATMRPADTPKTPIGARRRSSTSRLPERSWTRGMRTPWTPAIRMAIAMRPGTITVPKFAETRPSRGQDVAEDEDDENRLGQGRQDQQGGVAGGHHEVAAQEGEEGGHSRSPRPVRWM